MANDHVAPASWDGDQKGCQLNDDGVTVPDSFKEAYAKYVEGGWSTIAAPVEYGGQGLPLALSNAVTEMMNSNIGFQLCPMLSNGGMEAMAAHATEEQKEKYLRKVITGEWSATMNLTEPHAGSDVGNIRAKAEPQGDGSYKITGTKIYITYGDHDMTDNIIHLVLARTPGAPTARKVSRCLSYRNSSSMTMARWVTGMTSNALASKISSAFMPARLVSWPMVNRAAQPVGWSDPNMAAWPACLP